MRIVHLPFYEDNPYQSLLMDAQRELGHEVWAGGAGGNFLGVALRDWKADLLHFHWLHPYLLRESRWATIRRSARFLVEVALLKLRGAKIAWTIHNLVNHDGSHADLERRFSGLFARMTDACFVHSRAAAELAAQRFGIPPHKLHVIPHGHYIDVYPNTISRLDARARVGLPADATIFLFLGRIEPYKGVFDLIDALTTMPDHCHLLLAGKVANPELLPELERRCGGNTRIHHHTRRIPDEEIQVFYNAADVVVFPFRQILTSGSLVLAMSFGRGVVAPAVPSLMEILPEEGVRWFEPLQAGSLMNALHAAVSNDVQQGGAANRARAGEWSWATIAATILAACGWAAPITASAPHSRPLESAKLEL